MTRRGATLACLALVAGTVSCIDVGVDPHAVSSIQFLTTTNPSLVAGDTLRDTLGKVEPLRALVFGGDGAALPDIPVTFVTTDTFATVANDSLLVGRNGVKGSTTVYAVAGGLQSLVRKFEVIPRPDSIAPSGAATDTVSYRIPTAGSSIDSSTTVAFIVRAGTNAAGAVRVKYEIVRGGAVLGPGDTTTYSLVGPQGRVSTVDTTDGQGIVSRTLRVRTVAGTAIRDTIVVRANATIGGAALKGAPARVTILVLPAP